MVYTLQDIENDFNELRARIDQQRDQISEIAPACADYLYRWLQCDCTVLWRAILTNTRIIIVLLIIIIVCIAV